MPGSSLITADTLRLAEGYVQVRSIGRVHVKGLGAPVEAYEVTGAGHARTRMQVTAARGFTRFVGRDTEMNALHRAIDLVHQGHGQVVAVVGEPGIGKSRLFWEFTHSHHKECVRTLAETGSIEGERGAYRSARPIGEVQVPGTVQAVLAARIDRLSPDAKRLLQAAAAVGKDVPFPLLEAIADVPEDALRQGLAELQSTEFVYETRLFPDLEYTFKHALTHAVAYQSLLKTTRQHLHGRIARALGDRFAALAHAQPELLAHHLTECGRLDEAAAAWERAGDRAVSRSAFVEDIAHFRKGLEILETLPASAARARRELGVHLKLGGPLTATRGYAAPENLEVHSRARALCEETGETEALFDVLEGLWGYHYVKANLAIARELGDQLLAGWQAMLEEALRQTGGPLTKRERAWADGLLAPRPRKGDRRRKKAA